MSLIFIRGTRPLISNSTTKSFPRRSYKSGYRPRRPQKWQQTTTSNHGAFGALYSLWKPALFTLTVGGVSFSLSGVYATQSKHNIHQKLTSLYQENGSYNLFHKKLRRWWWEMGPVYRFITGIAAINTVVFLAWRIPALHNTMNHFFLSGTQNKGSLHLLGCAFSHAEFWHLALNMLAFSSFAGAAMHILGDRMDCSNILPFYLTAGTFASTVGYYSKLFRGNKVGSLGASGALLAVASLVILNNPDSNVYLIFFPFFPIKASMALGGVVALDLIGLLRGWKFFDHSCHLGGVFFAFLYKDWLHPVCKRIQHRSSVWWTKFRT